MKAFTDLEQSKKLAELLPLDSADMYYYYTEEELTLKGSLEVYHVHIPFNKANYEWYKSTKDSYTPCWSLAALLGILPNSIYDNTDEYSQLEFSKISVVYHDINDGIKIGSIKDNLVDACYEIILKLYEQKLL